MKCTQCQTELLEDKFKCPACGHWNPPPKQITIGTAQLIPLSKVKRHSIPRIKTGPWDIAFGGGIFPGTVSLIGGKPGIGKSTLLLQIADAVAGLTFMLPEEIHDMNSRMGKVIYIHTEEGDEQVAATADRLCLANQDRLLLFADTEIEIRDTVLEEMLIEAKPDLLILDSLPGFAGDSDPTRALELLKLFKKKLGILTMVSNHVNKEEEQSGYRDIEHAVDCTMLFTEDDTFLGSRNLTTKKNRHGPAPITIHFDMTDKGLVWSNCNESPQS